MGGLFGGLLEGAHILGGSVLAFLIGVQSATRPSGLARFVRIIFGSASVGAILGVFVGLILNIIFTLNNALGLEKFIFVILVFCIGCAFVGMIIAAMCGAHSNSSEWP